MRYDCRRKYDWSKSITKQISRYDMMLKRLKRQKGTKRTGVFRIDHGTLLFCRLRLFFLFLGTRFLILW